MKSKTKEVDFNILRIIKKSKGNGRLWVCGEDYYRDILNLDREMETEYVYYSHFGTRSILDIPVQIGHEKIGHDEIILLNQTELNIIKRQNDN